MECSMKCLHREDPAAEDCSKCDEGKPKLRIALTPEQSKHLESIKWLMSDLRGAGKSTVMAVAFIEKAVSTGRWVQVFDHTYYSGHAARMLDRVRLLLTHSKILDRFEFKESTRSFRLSPTVGAPEASPARSDFRAAAQRPQAQ